MNQILLTELTWQPDHEGKIWDEITGLSHRHERVHFVSQHAELLRHDVVSELTALVPRLVKADTSKALPVAEIALIIAERLHDHESLAQSLRAKANALYALGRNKAAIDYHRKAVTLFRSIDNAEQVARTLSSSIQPLILRGHYDLALAAAQEAQSIFEKQGNQWRFARVELNLGNIYDRQDRIEDALKCYEQAYEYLSLRGEEDPEGVAVALHNMAVSYVRLNEFRRAMTTYQQARHFALTHDMPSSGWTGGLQHRPVTLPPWRLSSRALHATSCARHVQLEWRRVSRRALSSGPFRDLSRIQYERGSSRGSRAGDRRLQATWDAIRAGKGGCERSYRDGAGGKRRPALWSCSSRLAGCL